MKLNATAKKFVVHWGEMSPFWGINKSVAQIYGLLYVCGKPMSSEDVAKSLGLGKSQVTIAIKELQSWGIVRPSEGAKDHFEALDDVWDAFARILRERKKREIDPTLKVLRDCISKGSASKGHSAEETASKQRLAGMLEFFELTSSLADRASALPPKSFKRLAQTGNTIFQVAGVI